MMRTLSVLLFAVGLGAADIPPKLDVDSYTIDVRLDKDCRVEIYKETGRVRILYEATKVSSNTGYTIEVLKLLVPLPKENISIDKFLDKIVIEDTFGLHTAVFGRRIPFEHDLIIKAKGKFGYTRHYVDSNYAGSSVSRLFARTSVIIKAYDKSSLAIYLVCGVEMNAAARINPTWLELVSNIIEGIEETKAPEQKASSAPATPG